jgi:hypothetical protein
VAILFFVKKLKDAWKEKKVLLPPVEIGQDGRRFGGDFSVLSSRFCLDLDNNEREWLLAFIASTFYKGPVKLFKKEKVCIYLFLSLYLHFSRSSARARATQ